LYFFVSGKSPVFPWRTWVSGFFLLAAINIGLYNCTLQGWLNGVLLQHHIRWRVVATSSSQIKKLQPFLLSCLLCDINVKSSRRRYLG
jgi:hypothetical protein